MDTRMTFLQSIPLFSHCSPSDLHLLATQVDEACYEAGATLIVEGQQNDTFFILTKGEVEITVSGEPLGRMGPGNIIGEISMMYRGPAIATVVAATPIETLVMGHRQFSAAIESNDDLATRVVDVMSNRLRATTIV